jgi:hypothetical protein
MTPVAALAASFPASLRSPAAAGVVGRVAASTVVTIADAIAVAATMESLANAAKTNPRGASPSG